MLRGDVGESWVKCTWTRSTPSMDVPALWPMTLNELCVVSSAHTGMTEPRAGDEALCAMRDWLEDTYSGLPQELFGADGILTS